MLVDIFADTGLYACNLLTKPFKITIYASLITFFAPCPFCLSMFEDARGFKNAEDSINSRDIAELVAESLGMNQDSAATTKPLPLEDGS